jgi:hypothetical protein
LEAFVGSAPDNPINPTGPDIGSNADGNTVAVPVDELQRLAQIFDAAADDVDAAVDRLHRSVESTVLNRDDPEFSPRSVADGTAAIRAALRPVTARLRADAGLMAATAFEVVEADAPSNAAEALGAHDPSPAQIDETAGWLGRVAEGLPPSPEASTAGGVDEPGTDPVWDRVLRETGDGSGH